MSVEKQTYVSPSSKGKHLKEWPTKVQSDPGQQGIFSRDPINPALTAQVSAIPTHTDRLI